jgi:hypothetical protein
MCGPYLRAALLCKSVSYDVDGAMTINGIYDQITLSVSAVFPVNLELKLVVSATRGDAQVGPVPLSIRIIDPDGSPVASIVVPFQLPESIPFTYAPMVTLKIHRTGLYWFELWVRDLQLGKLSLPIVQGTHIATRHSGTTH